MITRVEKIKYRNKLIEEQNKKEREEREYAMERNNDYKDEPHC